MSAEFRVTPLRPGLAVWTARADSLSGEASATNNARQVAVDVAPGRLGVLVVSRGLNWDLAFLRRALAERPSEFVDDRRYDGRPEGGGSNADGPATSWHCAAAGACASVAATASPSRAHADRSVARVRRG